jgi:RNA polymerase sigma factor (sigma-70 family)
VSLTDLIQKCLKDEPAAQKELYKLLAGKLFALCLRYTKNRQEAEDWLQDSFVKIFLNLDKFKNEGSFEGWARRITVNHLITEYRKSKRMGSVSDLESVIDISEAQESVNSALLYEELIKFVNLLPEGKKLVFNLAVIEGYSHKEIAELLNITEGASRGQLAKAREMLIEIHKKNNTVHAGKIY